MKTEKKKTQTKNISGIGSLNCFDCKKEIKEGYQYKPENTKEVFYKCDECFKKDPVLSNYFKQDCVVMSRVAGYYSSVKQWNQGKNEEFKDRKTFKIK
jgi:anaerobic ribonucleoside-triphosphate reductase